MNSSKYQEEFENSLTAVCNSIIRSSERLDTIDSPVMRNMLFVNQFMTLTDVFQGILDTYENKMQPTTKNVFERAQKVLQKRVADLQTHILQNSCNHSSERVFRSN